MPVSRAQRHPAEGPSGPRLCRASRHATPVAPAVPRHRSWSLRRLRPALWMTPAADRPNGVLSNTCSIPASLPRREAPTEEGDVAAAAATAAVARLNRIAALPPGPLAMGLLDRVEVAGPRRRRSGHPAAGLGAAVPVGGVAPGRGRRGGRRRPAGGQGRLRPRARADRDPRVRWFRAGRGRHGQGAGGSVVLRDVGCSSWARSRGSTCGCSPRRPRSSTRRRGGR